MKKAVYWVIVCLLLAVIIVGCCVLFWPGETDRAEESAPPETTQAEATTESDKAAPGFTVYDADGNPVRLSDFRGKPVVLNFWASWCGPCKSEMPDFEEVYQEMGDQVQFMMVNLTDGTNETVETASALIGEQGYTFPVFYDTDMDAANAYQIYSIPMTCLIDGNGDLLDLHIGAMSGEELKEQIQTVLLK